MKVAPQEMNQAVFDENQQTAKPRITSHATIDVPKKTKKAKGAFRTISEVANKLGVQQHVLRFWETKFSQVKPLKRGGGRRYYRPEDVMLLDRIHHLLYTEGYTIKGVQKLLKEHGKANIIAQAEQAKANDQPQEKAPVQQPVIRQAAATSIDVQQRAMLEILLAELKAMRSLIRL